MKMTEQMALDNLGIQDWRHMSKDKVMAFMSLVPQMNPEVAKAALAQFPKYVELSTEMIKNCKEYIAEGLTHASDSQKKVLEAHQAVLNTISLQLQQENLTDEMRKSLIEQQIDILNKMYAKDSEFKKFIQDMASTLLSVAGAVILVGGSAIGSVIVRRKL